MIIDKKIEKLGNLFSKSDKIIVAFSGGVDSTFLLYSLAVKHSMKVMALTIKTPYIPQWEVDEAAGFCKDHSIDHEIIKMPFPKSVISNPGDRCYRCKKILFSRISDYALKNGYNIIVDGSNADDVSDYRPGMKALQELKIISPLLESGITKDEIRSALKDYDLDIWNKPAYACLLTRIPHDTLVDDNMLSIIENAELILKEIGYAGTRVRLHNDIARLECSPDHIVSLCQEKVRSEIVSQLKHLGIKYVTLDLEGYRMGSLNSANND